MTWRGALPHRVAFNTRTVRIEPHAVIDAIARLLNLDDVGQKRTRATGWDDLKLRAPCAKSG
jgi:hypothetical protein